MEKKEETAAVRRSTLTLTLTHEPIREPTWARDEEKEEKK